MANHRFTDGELASLSVPTLFLAAADDQLCPPECHGESRRRVPGAAIEVLPDAAHSVYYEQPEVWTGAVLKFIGGASNSCDMISMAKGRIR